MLLFWFLLSLCLFICELIKPSIVFLWFAIGSLFALLGAFIGLPYVIQLLIFIFSSTFLSIKCTKKILDFKNAKYNSVLNVRVGRKS